MSQHYCAVSPAARGGNRGLDFKSEAGIRSESQTHHTPVTGFRYEQKYDTETSADSTAEREGTGHAVTMAVNFLRFCASQPTTKRGAAPHYGSKPSGQKIEYTGGQSK